MVKKCPYCNKEFPDKQALNRHMFNVHDIGLAEARPMTSGIFGKPQEEEKKTKEDWASKIKNRWMEYVLYAIIGIIVFLFGFFLIAGAIWLIPFYNMLPKKHKVKPFLKLSVILLIAFEFFIFHPQPFIALIVLWVGYFSMPTAYREDEDEIGMSAKGIESWLRMIVGAILSFSIFFAFGSTAAIIPIVLMAFAFFVTPPQKKASGGGIHIEIDTKGVHGKEGQVIDTAIFIGLMLLALMYGTLVGGWLSDSFGYIVLIFWVFSFLAGWFSGRSGRPYIGVIMIVVALFIFSFQYTGTVGAQLFGAYWPTVEHYGSMIAEPVGNVIEQARQGAADAWLMMTCPSCYYQEMEERDQAEESITTGTVKSIELKNFKIINYGTGDSSIDPAIPLVGTVQLKNEGEFSANDIRVSLKPPIVKDPSKVGSVFDSSVDCWIDSEEANSENNKYCTYMKLLNDQCVFTSCLGSDQDTSCDTSSDCIYSDAICEKGRCVNPGLTECTWTDDVTVPGELKLLTFNCGEEGEDEGKWSNTLNLCDCHCRAGTECELDDITKKCKNTDSCCCKNTIAKEEACSSNACDLNYEYMVYTYSDFYLTFNMDYQFDYSVDVKNDITIMDRDIYLEKLTNNEIRPKEIDSYYTGGPVKISIAIQDQPLRDGETSYATVSILNEGKGILFNSDPDDVSSGLEIKIPKDIVPTVGILSQTRFEDAEDVEVSSIIIDGIDYHVIKKKLDAQGGGLEKNKIARFTFTFVGDIGEDIIEKSTNVIGEFNYTYSTNKKIDSSIIRAPLQ